MIAHDAPGRLPGTPSRTAGPCMHIGLIPKQAGFGIFAKGLGETLLTPARAGTRIRVEGRILDGTGAPVRDAVTEAGPADAAGRYAHPADRQPGPAFRGRGRRGTGFAAGLWSSETVKPGAVGRCPAMFGRAPSRLC